MFFTGPAPLLVKPSTPVPLNMGDSLCRGLIFSATFPQLAAPDYSVRPSYGPLRKIVPATNTPWRADTSGLGWNVAGVSSSGITGGLSAASDALVELNAGEDYSFQIVIDSIGASGGANPGFWRASSGGVDAVGSTFFISEGAGRRPWFRLGGTDVIRPSTGPQWTDGSKLNVIVRVFSSGIVDVWWDGIQQYTASPAIATGAERIYVFGYQFSAGENINGTYQSIRFWKRGLGVGEVKALQKNPWQIFQAPSRPIWIPAVASGTITLSGQSVTTTPGSLAAGISKALTGQALTTSLGTLGKGISKALTGQGLTGSLGSLPRGLSKALSGQGLTISQGTLAPSGAGTAALTGQSLTCSTGTLTVSVSKALSGQALTSARGSLSPTISLSLSGQSATGTLGTLSPGISKALLGVSLTGSVGNLSISSGTSVLIKAGSWIRYRTL